MSGLGRCSQPRLAFCSLWDHESISHRTTRYLGEYGKRGSRNWMNGNRLLQPPCRIPMRIIKKGKDLMCMASKSKTEVPRQRRRKKESMFRSMAEMVGKITLVHWQYAAQLTASALFVVLYVWGTYSSPSQGSWRYFLDLGLLVFFAADYIFRLKASGHPTQAARSISNVVDLLSFLPSLVEGILGAWGFQFLDFSWVRIFRVLRVLRLCVITLNLSDIRHLSSSDVVDGAIRVKIAQLVATIIGVVFTSASAIHLFEKMPWHVALYFVVTTLTTVGFGDVAIETIMGRGIVVVMMISAVMVIPVKVTQMFREATSQRRRIKGALPSSRSPFVLTITNISNVRGFSDFFTEFYTYLNLSQGGRARMVCLTSNVSFETEVVQELYENSLTLVQGSAFSEADLIRCQAHKAEMLFLLADRFSTSGEQEDLKILFEAWAIKSYTKTVPLFVQVLTLASVARVSQFLDPSEDIIISLEQIRYRLLVLSCLCPGAATLLGNLIRASKVSKEKERVMGGRRWRRDYVNGCKDSLFQAKVTANFFQLEFKFAAQLAFRSRGIMIIGILRSGKLLLNPRHVLIHSSDLLIVIARSQQHADALGTIQIPERSIMSTSRTQQQAQSVTGMEDDRISAEDRRDDEVNGKKLVGETPTVKSLREREWRDELSPFKILSSFDNIVKGSESEAFEGLSHEQVAAQLELSDIEGHVIISGHADSFSGFVKELHRCSAQLLPVVVLHDNPDVCREVLKLSRVFFAHGSSTTKAGLQAAKAEKARCLIHLSQPQRSDNSPNPEQAVLADAQALLTSYTVGVGLHSVVELGYTSSINFLLPGMLLKDNVVVDDYIDLVKSPRKSWEFRKEQLKAAREEGLAEWQANPYYCAGRVLIPALLDTIACHSFLGKGLLIDLLAELTGDVGSKKPGGPLLSRAPLPKDFISREYHSLVSYYLVERRLLPIGLSRRKFENSNWLLRYVVVNPHPDTILDCDDMVYVIREPFHQTLRE